MMADPLDASSGKCQGCARCDNSAQFPEEHGGAASARRFGGIARHPELARLYLKIIFGLLVITGYLADNSKEPVCK